MNIDVKKPRRMYLWKWLIAFGVVCSLLGCTADRETTQPSPTSPPTSTPVPLPSPTPEMADPQSGTLRILEAPAGSEWSWSIAISPDGAVLASGMADGNVILWNVADGTILHTLAGPDSMARVAFSPDGSILASAGLTMVEDKADSTIRLWRVADGELLRVLEGHPYDIVGLAFSLDGSVLYSVSMYGTLKSWQVKDGTLLSEENLLSAGLVLCVATSLDRTILALAGTNGSASLWQLADRTYLYTLTGHEESVWSAALSPNGEILATGGGDRTTRLWRVADGTMLHTLEEPTRSVSSLAFSPDGTILASSGKQSPIFSAPSVGDPGGDTVRLWNVADGTLLRTLEGHAGDVISVAFSPDGNVLASSSADGTIRLWRIQQ